MLFTCPSGKFTDSTRLIEIGKAGESKTQNVKRSMPNPEQWIFDITRAVTAIQRQALNV